MNCVVLYSVVQKLTGTDRQTVGQAGPKFRRQEGSVEVELKAQVCNLFMMGPQTDYETVKRPD